MSKQTAIMETWKVDNPQGSPPRPATESDCRDDDNCRDNFGLYDSA